MVYNIPRRHLPLLCFWRAIKVCEVLSSQRQKRRKRLFLNICMFPLTHAAYRLLGKGTMQNYEIYLGKENIITENMRIFRFSMD